MNVESLEARHAPALLQLLVKGEVKCDWNLLFGIEGINHLVKVCMSLDIVDLGVLPLLEGNGMDLAAGRLLRRFGKYIRRYAREVDGRHGVFCHAAADVSRILVDASDNLVKEEEPIGVEQIAAMREAMEGLKLLLVLLPDEEAGGGDGGGAGGAQQ